MKISQVDLAIVKQYLRVTSNDDDTFIASLIPVAKDYIKGYTGLNDTIITEDTVIESELDKHESLTIALLCLISDMYDVRGLQVQNTTVNPTVHQILSMYNRNFL